MARRRRVVPRPPAGKPPKLIALGPGSLWRVHARSHGATEFNRNGRGDARFSPPRGSDGTIVPTLYGSNTLAGAMMESVFHDVPTPPGEYILDVGLLRQQDLVVSRIRPVRRLPLIDLSTKGLKRLGLHRTDLIDTPVSAYPRAREWGEWFHDHTEASGLLWTSRQDDGSRALVLFGDRVEKDYLEVQADREPLCEDAHLDELLGLAEHIGIDSLFGL